MKSILNSGALAIETIDGTEENFLGFFDDVNRTLSLLNASYFLSKSFKEENSPSGKVIFCCCMVAQYTDW